MSRKIGGLFVFIGLVLIGLFFYQEYVGDIPYVSNLFYSMSKKTGVTGSLVKVKQLDKINYNLVGGEEYDPDIEEVNGNFNKSYSFNMLIGSDVYKFSFMYPENLNMTNADKHSLTFSADDHTRINFSYSNSIKNFKEFVNNHNNYDTTGYKDVFKHYYYKTFTTRNKLTNVLITNSYSESKNKSTSSALATNATEIILYLYDLQEKGVPFSISIYSYDKKISDKFLMNFYNSFSFERVDDDLQMCHLKNNKYVCSINLSKFDLTNKKKVTLEFNKDLFEFTNNISDPQVIPCSVNLKPKESKNSEVYYGVNYSSYENSDYFKNNKKYVEEIIDGRKFLVKVSTNQENLKQYFYEIEPNIHIEITIQASEDIHESLAKIFTNFKVE